VPCPAIRMLSLVTFLTATYLGVGHVYLIRMSQNKNSNIKTYDTQESMKNDLKSEVSEDWYHREHMGACVDEKKSGAIIVVEIWFTSDFPMSKSIARVVSADRNPENETLIEAETDDAILLSGLMPTQDTHDTIESSVWVPKSAIRFLGSVEKN
jgi:hypothetical protein